MKRHIFVLSLVLLAFTGVGAQEYRLKAFLIPLLDHSVAGEVLFLRRLSFQLAYQNHVEWGDNRYFHHRIIPSFRCYHLTENRFFDRFYAELFHRSAFIRHIPDQSDVPIYDHRTQSVGLSLGKQILFKRNFLTDVSFGRYRIYSGDGMDDYSDFNLFPYTETDRWRIDVKVGWVLGKGRMR